MKNFALKCVWSDGAVVPENRSLPVCGFAPAGKNVQISFGGVSVECTAGADNTFCASLPAFPAGGPYVLVASCDGETIEVKDVMVGKVFLCSGQSNMAYHLGDQRPTYEESELSDLNLRFFRVPHNRELGGVSDVDAQWLYPVAEADKKLISAAAFAFAKSLAAMCNCAVGIIENGCGGSCIASWLDRESLESIPEYRERLQQYDAISDDVLLRQADGSIDSSAMFNTFMDSIICDVVPVPALEKTETDDTFWKKIDMPSEWSVAGFDDCGVYALRKHFTLPEAWAGKKLILSLGGIDQQDVTFVNGVEVGRTGENSDMSLWNKCRKYEIDPQILHPGDNLIVVRAISRFYMVQAGGFSGPEEAMFIAPADDETQKIPLGGAWKIAPEQLFPVRGWALQMIKSGCVHTLNLLYDNMFRPVAHYPVSGVVWYQGEADSCCRQMAEEYKIMLRALRDRFRKNYDDPALPFYIVQLPGFQRAAVYEKDSLWALVRNAQLEVALEDGSYPAVTADIGMAWEIHPPDKREVGRRIALLTYGIHGPRLTAVGSAGGNRMFCRFDHYGSGLRSREMALRGFAVAGSDKVFYPAIAEITGFDTVELYAPEVDSPRYAAYGFAANPEWADLYGENELPASPFNTAISSYAVKEEF